MLIEQCAYNNGLRRIEPAAKVLFISGGLIGGLLGKDPAVLGLITVINGLVTVIGAKIRWRVYLRVFLPPLFFLAAGGTALALSLEWGGSFPGLSVHIERSQLHQAVLVCSRSLACVGSTLFLALTTPMTDLTASMRRLKIPDILLDIMTLGYRMISVFMESVRGIHVAQSARLGHSTYRRGFRSLALLATNITAQVWRRAQALQLAALARNSNGPLRFLETDYVGGWKSIAFGALGGCLLLLLSQVHL